MNPSILLTPKPSIPFSPFLTPPSQIPLQQRRRHRFRYRIPSVNCSSSDQSFASSAPVSSDVFGGKKELTALQSVVDSMSPPVRLVSSALIFAGAVSAGYGLGFRIGGAGSASLGGAVVLGAAGAGASYALNSSVPEVAALSLHNYVAGSDPSDLRKEDIDGIASKYGVSKQNEAFIAELSDIYGRYVSAVLPAEGEDLKGDEADLIIKFKNALGIDDPDAAAVHMEIGRRIFRQRLETGDREGDSEQRRAFQKLIYISTLVFGEASTFLLPWKRVFKVTDSQVEVAIRDNAQRLYISKLKSIGQDVTPEQLIKLRNDQLTCKLSDELAEDMFREHMRKLIEENIAAGLSILKSRQRTAKEASLIVEELNKVLAFNNLLISLKNHPDASNFARGLGPVTLLGGEYDGDRKMDDLKVLYRAYLADSLSSGHVEKDKLAALNQLKNIFGLGKRETESITLDVTTKLYRKRLAQSLTDGSLEAADSKAGFLQNLCEGLRFDPQKATVIHEEIYRQKLQQSATAGLISEENLKELEKLQVLLCIPKKTVEAAKAEICDSQFEKVVWDAIAAGVGGYDEKVKQSVRKAAYGLRLSREAALSIAGKAVRKIFMSHIQSAGDATEGKEYANTIKKMISFNSLVVTKLIEDIKGKSPNTTTTTSEEPPEKEKSQSDEEDEEEIKSEDDEEDKKPVVIDEWRNLESLQKVLSEESKSIPRQSDITLKKDLPFSTRAAIYKAYLLYARTGDVRDIPFGASVIIRNDDSEFANLYQLAGILGLSDKSIISIHKKLAQEDFRDKAEDILADGKMTEQKVKQLKELQEKVGLPSEYSQKIIKSITTSKFASAIETAMAQGSLGIKEIKELKEAGVDVQGLVSRSYRNNLYVNAVEAIFSSGTGEFDEEQVCEKLPSDLIIETDRARSVVQDIARKRSSNTLLQAVSQLRQRDTKGVISSLNDLLACDKAVQLSPLSWEVPEELGDLFLVYAKSNPAPEKLSRVQYLLDISDSTAESLGEMKDKPVAIGGASEEEFVF